MKIVILTIAMISLMPIGLQAQTRMQIRKELATIDSIDKMFLDSGIDNMANEDWYNSKMDQLLNKTYRVVMEASTPEQKQTLKIEQRAWLKKRDRNTKEVRRAITRENGEGTITEQVTFQGEADFVRKRVLYLIGKMKS